LDVSVYSPQQSSEIGFFASVEWLTKMAAKKGGNEKKLLQALLAYCSSIGKAGYWVFKQRNGDKWAHGSLDPEAMAIFESATSTLNGLHHCAVHMTGGADTNREGNVLRLINLIDPFKEHIETAFIPAVRSTRFTATSNGHSVKDDIFVYDGIADLGGANLIERLFKLQNPTHLEKQSEQRFKALTEFVQTTIRVPNARISVPYDKSVTDPAIWHRRIV
jgi:hypothetical protein